MNLLTIRQLAALAGVSRAGLLYYETEGLLVPARRSASGYRLYGQKEVQLVQTIRAFRDAGVPVRTIKDILKNQSSVSVQLLEQRLFDLNSEMRNLKEQQILLARLLAQATLGAPGKVKNKEAWVALMRAAGLSDDDMKRWHAAFEASAPDAHKKFLESLKLPPKEVEAIRGWAKGL